MSVTVVEIVAFGYFCLIRLIEQFVGILQCLVVTLEVCKVEERYTVEGGIARELVVSELRNLQTLFKLAFKEVGECKVHQLVVFHLRLVHLCVVLYCLVQITGLAEYLSGDESDGIVGYLLFHLFQFGNGCARVSLAVHLCVAAVTVGVFRVEIDSLLEKS